MNDTDVLTDLIYAVACYLYMLRLSSLLELLKVSIVTRLDMFTKTIKILPFSFSFIYLFGVRISTSLFLSMPNCTNMGYVYYDVFVAIYRMQTLMF